MDIKTQVFPSDLGYMGIVVANNVIVKTCLGYVSETAIMAHLESVNSNWISNVSGDTGGLAERFLAYANGEPDDFADLQIDCSWTTDFQSHIIESARKVAYGDTISYGELAEAAGYANAARAVGSVMARNRFPLIVPCHRVIASNNRVGGFSAGEGVNLKLRLLELEGAVSLPG